MLVWPGIYWSSLLKHIKVITILSFGGLTIYRSPATNPQHAVRKLNETNSQLLKSYIFELVFFYIKLTTRSNHFNDVFFYELVYIFKQRKAGLIQKNADVELWPGYNKGRYDILCHAPTLLFFLYIINLSWFYFCCSVFHFVKFTYL